MAAAVGDDDLPAAAGSPWRFRRRRLSDLGTWPLRVGVCAAVAVLIGVMALQERGAFNPPVPWGLIVLVGVAVLPWLIDLLVAIVPPWVFAPVVVVPVALLHQPRMRDPLVFLLAVLALDMGLQLGAVRSAPFVLAGPGIITWQEVTVTGGVTRLVALLAVAVGAAWLVGLAMHSQVRRIAGLRRAQEHIAARAAEDGRARAYRDVDHLLRPRLEDHLADLASIRADAPADDHLDGRLEQAERRARELVDDLEARVGQRWLDAAAPPGEDPG